MSRKTIVILLATLMAVAPSSHRAFAQDLDDAIDAELDEVAEGDAPSTEPNSGTTAPTVQADSLDDIELDEGDAAEPAPQKKASAEKPKSAPKSEDPLIDDTLDLDADEETAVAQPTDVPKVDDTDVELDGDDDVPAVAETPQDPANDLDPDLDTEIANDVPAGAPSDVPTNASPVEPSAPVRTKRPVAIDAPNDAYEKRLSQISGGYKQVPDVSWEEIVGDRRQENYGIQRGDTLWDISETFFGDGFFWAKLWSQNGVIGNPHMIVRGKAIRFVAGTEGDAPAIGVMDTLVASNQEVVSINPLRETVNERPTYREQVENDITAEEVESGVVLEADELIPAPTLPPPSKRTKLLRELPGSFRPPVAEQFNLGYDASGIKGAPSIRAREAAKMMLNSIALDKTPDQLGRVDEIEAQERVAGKGQSVFVRLNKEVPAGTKITFARLRPRPSGAAGPIIDIQGVGVVTTSVHEGRNAYRATVINSLVPVEKGVAVFEFAPPTFVFTREGRRNEAQVTVVGGEYDDKRRLVGAGSIIYLAGGKNVNLQVGDIMGVEAVRGERRQTSYPKVKTPIAIIKIADVRERSATAVILVSTQPVVVGDRTGGEVPEALPSLRSESVDDIVKGFSLNSTSIEEAPAAPKKVEPNANPIETDSSDAEMPADESLDIPDDMPADVPADTSDDLDATLD